MIAYNGTGEAKRSPIPVVGSTELRARGAGQGAQSSGRRAQGAERRAQGAERRAQGSGRGARVGTWHGAQSIRIIRSAKCNYCDNRIVIFL